MRKTMREQGNEIQKKTYIHTQTSTYISRITGIHSFVYQGFVEVRERVWAQIKRPFILNG